MTDSDRTNEVADLLRRCQLFAVLERDDLLKLAEYARRERRKAGEIIFHAGDDGESMMGILAGEVRIVRPSDEGEIIIADFGPGEVFGEIAVLDGGGRSAEAIAHTNCELVVLERRYLVPVLLERPQLSIELLKLVCGKLREADERSSDFLFLDLETRLAKAMLRLCESSATEGRPGRTSLTQGELAKVVGATRPNVNRQLKSWERGGIVAMNKGWITIANRPRLQTIADRSPRV